MVPVGTNSTEHLLSMGAEYTDKCRNESAFGKNGFRRSAGAPTVNRNVSAPSATLRIGEACWSDIVPVLPVWRAIIFSEAESPWWWHNFPGETAAFIQAVASTIHYVALTPIHASRLADTLLCLPKTTWLILTCCATSASNSASGIILLRLKKRHL